MRRWLALVLFAATIAPSAPATAQEPGPELERTYFRTAAGPRSLARYADCLINRHPQEARAMFDHDPGSFAFREAQAAIFENSSSCLFSNRSLGFSGVMMMGAFAEHLIRKDKPAKPVRPLRAAEFAGGGTFRWQWQGLQSDNEQRLVLLSECLWARHGDKADAVLAARANDESERKAFNAMRTELADCVPLGESRVLNPQQLRAALAMTYYRAARAATSSSEAAG